MTDSADVESLIDAETARLVRQEHPHGCGIAALAMITSRTYAEVFTELLGYAGKGDWITEERVTQSGLHKGIVDWYLAKHDYVWRTLYAGWQLDPWPPLPFAPVHICNVVQPSENTHFVILTATGVVLDPMVDTPRLLTDWSKVNNVQGVWKRGSGGHD